MPDQTAPARPPSANFNVVRFCVGFDKREASGVDKLKTKFDMLTWRNFKHRLQDRLRAQFGGPRDIVAQPSLVDALVAPTDSSHHDSARDTLNKIISDFD